MRARLLVIGALLALAGAPSAHAGGCARTLPHGPRVPAPLLVRTVCGVFELRRDGSVVYARTPRWAPAWAPGAISHPDPRTWVAHRHRRLAIYRDGRLLWRSHVTGGSDNVAVGQGHVAFTSYQYSRSGTLWIAPIGGRERMVGRNEEVVGWVPAGLITQRRADLRLRARDGRFLRHLARARTALMDGHDAVILRTDGRIVRTNGWHSRTLADLRHFGLTAYPWLQRIDGGLWQVEARNRLLFLERDGRRFASLRHSNIAGNVVVLPDRSAVLFVVRSRASQSDPGVLTVERLERGGRIARPLFSARVRQLSCSEWGGLDYRAGRVLFSSTGAGAAILDPAGRARAIDLTRFTQALLPRKPGPPAPSYVGWVR
jgi:hypothetical protein